MAMDDETADATLSLAALAFTLAGVNRVTRFPDGVTPESDTDHTVMLGLIACALASKCEPSLDIGKVAQFALVHDLVEAYAGDTNTYGLVDEEVWKEKAAREEAAFERIKKEFTALPWIAEMIEKYESLGAPEARFIKTLDKCMPKMTRLLNNGAHYSTPEEFLTHCDTQMKKMKGSYARDQKIVCELFEYFKKKTYAMLVEKTKQMNATTNSPEA